MIDIDKLKDNLDVISLGNYYEADIQDAIKALEQLQAEIEQLEITIQSKNDVLSARRTEIEQLKKDNSLLKSCLIKHQKFVNEVSPQVGKLFNIDFGNYNDMCIEYNQTLPKPPEEK